MSRTGPRYALAEGVAFQVMGEDEDTVVLALAEGQLYSCNETATALLQAIETGGGLGEAAERIVQEFDVSLEQAESDLAELASQLLAEGLIVEQD